MCGAAPDANLEIGGGSHTEQAAGGPDLVLLVGDVNRPSSGTARIPDVLESRLAGKDASAFNVGSLSKFPPASSAHHTSP